LRKKWIAPESEQEVAHSRAILCFNGVPYCFNPGIQGKNTPFEVLAFQRLSIFAHKRAPHYSPRYCNDAAIGIPYLKLHLCILPLKLNGVKRCQFNPFISMSLLPQINNVTFTWGYTQLAYSIK
ncbi:MAG: hypothetical protein ACRCR1_12725, partial [Aeromonas sp.]